AGAADVVARRRADVLRRVRHAAHLPAARSRRRGRRHGVQPRRSRGDHARGSHLDAAADRVGASDRRPAATRDDAAGPGRLMGYCEIAPGHPFHGPYHDREYGFPLSGDDALFERLVLEINQAGLSWLTILKKREAFRAAYDGFDVETVAEFDEDDRERLLA